MDEFLNAMLEENNKNLIDPTKYTPTELLKKLYNGFEELKSDIKEDMIKLNAKIDGKLDSLENRIVSLETKYIEDKIREKRNLRLYKILTWIFGASIAIVGLLLNVYKVWMQ